MPDYAGTTAAARRRYKASCDICGARRTSKRRIWSYLNKKGVMTARCRKHLTTKRTKS